MNELIIIRDNAYNEFCPASATQLAGLLDRIAATMGQGSKQKITVICRETRRQTTITVGAGRKSYQATAKAALGRLGEPAIA